MKRVCSLLLFVLMLFIPSTSVFALVKSLGDLEVGDKVVDKSWEWEHLTGDTGTDEIKPVAWIVVAKEHYGPGSGVTLMAEEIIGTFTFDNSTNIHEWGSNHWGESGTHSSATQGLRSWLNSTGIHASDGFYYAFSDSFKDALLTTIVPNRRTGDGVSYTTQDKVFIPSTTELGDKIHNYTYEIGTVYPYYANAINADRIANDYYWTRSPDIHNADGVHFVFPCGSFFDIPTSANNRFGVRPTINLKSATPVSVKPDATGYFEIKPLTDHDYNFDETGWHIWDPQTVTEPQKIWRIVFNKAYDQEMVNNNTVYITDKNENIILVRYEFSQPELMVVPKQEYTPGETYNLWIKDLEAKDGSVLSKKVKMEFTVINSANLTI